MLSQPAMQKASLMYEVAAKPANTWQFVQHDPICCWYAYITARGRSWPSIWQSPWKELRPSSQPGVNCCVTRDTSCICVIFNLGYSCLYDIGSGIDHEMPIQLACS